MGFRWDVLQWAKDVVQWAARVISWDKDEYSTTDLLTEKSKQKIQQINTDNNKSNDINTWPIIDDARKWFSESVSQSTKDSLDKIATGILDIPLAKTFVDTWKEATNVLPFLANAAISWVDAVTDQFNFSKDWIADDDRVKPFFENTQWLFTNFVSPVLNVANNGLIDATEKINENFAAQNNDNFAISASKWWIRNWWNLASDVVAYAPRALRLASGATDGQFTDDDEDAALDFGRSAIAKFWFKLWSSWQIAKSAAIDLWEEAAKETWKSIFYKAASAVSDYIVNPITKAADKYLPTMIADAAKWTLWYLGKVSLPLSIVSWVDALWLDTLSDEARKYFTIDDIESASNWKLQKWQWNRFYDRPINNESQFINLAKEINPNITEDEWSKMYDSYLRTVNQWWAKTLVNAVKDIYWSTYDSILTKNSKKAYDEIVLAEQAAAKNDTAQRPRNSATDSVKESNPKESEEWKNIINNVYQELASKWLIKLDWLKEYDNKFSNAFNSLSETQRALLDDYSEKKVLLNNLEKELIKRGDEKTKNWYTIQELRDSLNQNLKDWFAIFALRNYNEVNWQSKEEAQVNALKTYYWETDVGKAREKYENMQKIGDSERRTRDVIREAKAMEFPISFLWQATSRIVEAANQGIQYLSPDKYSTMWMSRLYTELWESDISNSLQWVKEKLSDAWSVMLAEWVGMVIGKVLWKTVFKSLPEVRSKLYAARADIWIDSLLVDPTQSAQFAGIDNDKVTWWDIAISSVMEWAAGAAGILRLGKQINSRYEFPSSQQQWKAIITNGQWTEVAISNWLKEKINGHTYAINQIDNKILEINKSKILTEDNINEIAILTQEKKNIESRRSNIINTLERWSPKAEKDYKDLVAQADNVLEEVSQQFYNATKEFPKTEMERVWWVFRWIATGIAFEKDERVVESEKAALKRGADYINETDPSSLNVTTLMNRMYNVDTQDNNKIKEEQPISYKQKSYFKEEENYVKPAWYTVDRNETSPFWKNNFIREVVDQDWVGTWVFEVSNKKWEVVSYQRLNPEFQWSNIKYISPNLYFQARNAEDYTGKVFVVVWAPWGKTTTVENIAKRNLLDSDWYIVISSDEWQLNQNASTIAINEAIKNWQTIFIQYSGMYDSNMTERRYNKLIKPFWFKTDSIAIVKVDNTDVASTRAAIEKNIRNNNKWKSEEYTSALIAATESRYISEEWKPKNIDVRFFKENDLLVLDSEEYSEIKKNEDIIEEMVKTQDKVPVAKSLEESLAGWQVKNTAPITRKEKDVAKKVIKNNKINVVKTDETPWVSYDVDTNTITVWEWSTEWDKFIVATTAWMHQLYLNDPEFKEIINSAAKRVYWDITKLWITLEQAWQKLIDEFFTKEIADKLAWYEIYNNVSKVKELKSDSYFKKILDYIGKVFWYDFSWSNAIILEYRLRKENKNVSRLKKYAWSVIKNPKYDTKFNRAIFWLIQNQDIVDIYTEDSSAPMSQQIIDSMILDKDEQSKSIDAIVDEMFGKNIIEKDIKPIVAEQLDVKESFVDEVIEENKLENSINMIIDKLEPLAQTNNKIKASNNFIEAVSETEINESPYAIIDKATWETKPYKKSQANILVKAATKKDKKLSKKEAKDIAEKTIVLNAITSKVFSHVDLKNIIKNIVESKTAGLIWENPSEVIFEENNQTNLLSDPVSTIKKIEADLMSQKDKRSLEKTIDYWKQILLEEMIIEFNNTGKYLVKQFSYVMKTIFRFQNIKRPVVWNIREEILYMAYKYEDEFEQSQAFLEYKDITPRTISALKKVYDIEWVDNLNNEVSEVDLGKLAKKVGMTRQEIQSVTIEWDITVDLDYEKETGYLYMNTNTISWLTIDYNALHDLLQEKLWLDKEKNISYWDVVEPYIIENLYKDQADIDYKEYTFNNQFSELAKQYWYYLRWYHKWWKWWLELARWILDWDDSWIQESDKAILKNYPLTTSRLDSALDWSRWVPIEEVRNNIPFTAALMKLMGYKTSMIENIIDADDLSQIEKDVFLKYSEWDTLSIEESSVLKNTQEKIYEWKWFFTKFMWIKKSENIIIDKDMTFSSADNLPAWYEYAWDVTAWVYFNDQEWSVKRIKDWAEYKWVNTAKRITSRNNFKDDNDFWAPNNIVTEKIIWENYWVLFVSESGKLLVYKRIPNANITDIVNDVEWTFSPGTVIKATVDKLFETYDTTPESSDDSNVNKLIQEKKKLFDRKEIEQWKAIIDKSRRGELEYVKEIPSQKAVVTYAKAYPKEFTAALKNIVLMFNPSAEFIDWVNIDVSKLTRKKILWSVYNNNANNIYINAVTILKESGIMLDSSDGPIQKLNTINNLIVWLQKRYNIPAEFSREVGQVIDAINQLKAKKYSSWYLTESWYIDAILNSDLDSYNKESIESLQWIEINTESGTKSLYQVLNKYWKLFNITSDWASFQESDWAYWSDFDSLENESDSGDLESANKFSAINRKWINFFQKILEIIETDKNPPLIFDVAKWWYFAWGMWWENILDKNDTEREAKAKKWIKKELDYLASKNAKSADYRILAEYVVSTIAPNLKGRDMISKKSGKEIEKILLENGLFNKTSIILASPFSGGNATTLKGAKTDSNTLKRIINHFLVSSTWVELLKELKIQTQEAKSLFKDPEILLESLQEFKVILDQSGKKWLWYIKLYESDWSKKAKNIKEMHLKNISDLAQSLDKYITINNTDAESSLLKKKNIPNEWNKNIDRLNKLHNAIEIFQSELDAWIDFAKAIQLIDDEEIKIIKWIKNTWKARDKLIEFMKDAWFVFESDSYWAPIKQENRMVWKLYEKSLSADNMSPGQSAIYDVKNWRLDNINEAINWAHDIKIISSDDLMKIMKTKTKKEQWKLLIKSIKEDYWQNEETVEGRENDNIELQWFMDEAIRNQNWDESVETLAWCIF